jgi:PAS domain-containing protein
VAAANADARARELQAVFDAIPDGVYVGTADGIKEVNRAGLEMLGAKSVADLNARITELSDRFDVRSAKTGERIPADQLRFSRALRGETVSEQIIARRSSAPWR